VHGDSGRVGEHRRRNAGAVILVVLPEVLREVQMYRMLALGAGIVLLMIFRPQGLLEEGLHLLDIRGVSKHFGGIRAIEDISFSLKPGRY